MRKKMKNIAYVIACLLLCLGCFAFAACRDKNNGSKDSGVSSEIEDHYLYFEQYHHTLSVGDSKKLELLRVNVEGDASWRTENEDVASVADGVVTAKAVGESIISAQVGEYQATCKITVVEERREQSISFSFEEKHLTEGENCEIFFTLENATAAEVEFSCSDDGILSYDVRETSLYVRTLAAGKTTVSAVLGGKTTTVTFYITSRECVRLSAPTGIQVRDNVVSWYPVENASGYAVSLDNVHWIEIADTSYRIEDSEWSKIYVKALGDEISFLPSGVEYITDGSIWNGERDDMSTITTGYGSGCDPSSHVAGSIVEDAERGNVLQVVVDVAGMYPVVKITTDENLSAYSSAENTFSLSYWLKVAETGNGEGLYYIPAVAGYQGNERGSAWTFTKELLDQDVLATTDGWTQVTVSGLYVGMCSGEFKGITDNGDGTYSIYFYYLARTDISTANTTATILIDDVEVYRPTYRIFYDLGNCSRSEIDTTALTQEIRHGERFELLKPTCTTHTFVKWIVKDTQTEYSANVYDLREDLYLVAVWVETDEKEKDWSNWV